jgi:hypothetical protein
MDADTGEKPPPDSTDLDGWREVIAENRLGTLKLETLVAALQDLGPLADKRIRNLLGKKISDSMVRILRHHVGTNHPNRGEDIVARVHSQLIIAMLDPGSADGQGFREAFFARVMFRLKDGVAAEYRERRIPDETRRTTKQRKAENASSPTGADPDDTGEGLGPDPRREPEDEDDSPVAYPRLVQ